MSQICPCLILPYTCLGKLEVCVGQEHGERVLRGVGTTGAIQLAERQGLLAEF